VLTERIAISRQALPREIGAHHDAPRASRPGSRRQLREFGPGHPGGGRAGVGVHTTSRESSDLPGDSLAGLAVVSIPALLVRRTCGATGSPAQAKGRSGVREWAALAVLALPTLLISLDLFIMLMALPRLSASLHASSVQQLWMLDIYGFMVAGFLITMGTHADVLDAVRRHDGIHRPALAAGRWPVPARRRSRDGSGHVRRDRELPDCPDPGSPVPPRCLVPGRIAISVAGLLVVSQSASAAMLAAGFALSCFGTGPLVSLGTNIVVGSAPPQQAGAAAGVAQTGNECGYALGIAILGSAGIIAYRAYLSGSTLAGVPAASAVAARQGIGSALSMANGLPGHTRPHAGRRRGHGTGGGTNRADRRRTPRRRHRYRGWQRNDPGRGAGRGAQARRDHHARLGAPGRCAT
jgi:MFS family permease